MWLLKVCLLILYSASAISSSPLFAECRPISIIGEDIVLSSKGGGLFLLQNKTDGLLWLTHPVAEANASAGWTTQIQSGNWSALVVSEDAFILNCVESQPGHEQNLPCQELVSACFWQGVKIPEREQGTFWAAEDQTLSNLKIKLIQRGFALPKSQL